MTEPEVTIEVVGKQGNCICCGKPGRKRTIRAQYGRHIARESDIYCIPCANRVARGLKWEVYYADPPVCCQNTVSFGVAYSDQQQGRVPVRKVG